MDIQIMLTQQTTAFLYACLLGVGLGLIYDIFRILRLAVPSGGIIIFVEDLLFFLVAGTATFLFMIRYNSGMLRGFIFVGELLGFSVYYFSIGTLVYRIADALINQIRKIFHMLFRILVWPFQKAFGFIYQRVRSFFVVIYTKLKNQDKKLKMCLKRRRKVLYNKSVYKNSKNKKGAEPVGFVQAEKKETFSF
ncbi:MAG TPA: spore cortex biosynthesis protein YabQ [Firmicutes bacterium]|nr:spore cortex biosynthesis protein YabQ [Bacillota bacterium]